MANVTLSVPDELLQSARHYAANHDTSVNTLIRQLLANYINDQSSTGASPWLDEFFQLSEQAQGNSQGEKWSREDLYDV